MVAPRVHCSRSGGQHVLGGCLGVVVLLRVQLHVLVADAARHLGVDGDELRAVHLLGRFSYTFSCENIYILLPIGTGVLAVGVY